MDKQKKLLKMSNGVNKQKSKKSAQDIQDDIFRKMSASRKLEVASLLWQLGKNLAGDNRMVDYAKFIPLESMNKYSKVENPTFVIGVRLKSK